MSYPNLSTELLKTFVTVVEVDGFNRAGETLHKTQSTISQQIRRLEQEVGESLFLAAGRKRVLSPAGEIFINYARRLLALQDDAIRTVRHTGMETSLSIGLSQGLGEGVLPTLLGQFARSYPGITLSVESGFSGTLKQRFDRGEFDLILTLEGSPDGGQILATEDMVWIGAEGFEWSAARPLPLAGFSNPCQFSDASMQALDAAGIPWTLVYTTTSLQGLMAAVRAGLGVTVRARHAVGEGTEILTPRIKLPDLPEISVVLRHRSSAVAAELLTESVAAARIEVS